MTDTLILDRLQSNSKMFESISSRLDALQSIFLAPTTKDVEPTRTGFKVNSTMIAKTVFQSEDVSITTGIYSEEGDLFSDHSHRDSIEFLIVYRGSFLVKIDGNPRIMKKGECAAIPRGIRHSCQALEKDSHIVGICIPPEKAYLVEPI